MTYAMAVWLGYILGTVMTYLTLRLLDKRFK